MAIVTRRYSFVGPSNADLTEFVGSSAVQNDTFPYTVVDINIDDSTAGILTALDDYMSGLGWNFDPTAPDGEVGVVKVTSDDLQAQFLLDKIISGSTGVVISEINDGGIEDLSIGISGLTTGEALTASPVTVKGPTNSPGSSSSFVKADHQHRLEVDVENAGGVVGSRPAVKITGSGGVVATVTDDAGNDRVNVDVDGSAIVGDHKVQVSANDTTPDYLLAKLTAGTGIVLTEVNDGGDEDLRIDGTALTASAPVDVDKSAAAVGVATDAARADHKHDASTAAAGAIAVGDASAEGTATSLARSDHQHSLPAPPVPVNVTKAAASTGILSSVARADHKHDVDTAAPVATGLANAEGTSSSLARADHVHESIVNTQEEGVALPPQPALNFVGAAVTATDDPGNNRTNVTVTAAALTAAAPTSIEPDDAGAVGVATDAARADHQHAIVADPPVSIDVGDAQAEGVASAFSRSDHQHALAAPAAPVDVTKTAASAGVSAKVAREDHKHDVSTAAPSNVEGGTNAEGTATSLSRSDHQHRLEVDVLDDAIAAGQRPTINFTGAGVSVSDDGGNDRVNVTIPGGVGSDELVKVSAADTTAGYLNAKIVAGVGISLATLGGGGDEDLEITGVGLTAAAPVNVSRSPASAGVAASSARADHKHDVDTAVAGAIAVGDSAAEGVATTIARSDHRHSLAAPAAPANVDAAAASAGVSTKVAREDHKHSVSISSPVDTGTANAAGTANTLVRSDHVHKTQLAIEDDGVAQGAAHTVDFVGAGVTAVVAGDEATVTIPGGPPLADAAPSSIEPDDAGIVGVSTDAAREDHQHAIAAAAAGAIEIGDAAAEGAATSFSRSDHQHSLAAPGAPADVDAAAASAGVSTAPARADHKHDIATAAPVNVEGGTNAEGTSNSMSRADHQHRLEVDVLDDALAIGQRPTLNFTGGGVTVADDVGNDRVNISIPGGVVLTNIAPVDVDGAAAAVGVSGEAARADHKHDIATAAPDGLAAGDSSAEGVSNSMARADHQHGVPVGAPVSTGGANASGVATSFSRSDHVHVGTVEVEDEGGSVAREPVINFIGAGVTAVAGTGKVDVTVPGGLSTKAGCVAAGSFVGGSPKTATVTFATPFADANYSVTLMSVTINNATFNPAVATKLAGSFVINLGSGSTNNLTEVCWLAVKNGETA